MRSLLPIVCLAGLAPASCLLAQEPKAAPAPLDVSSPDGRVKVTVSFGERASVPVFSVTFRDRPILLPSPLGLDLADGTALGVNSIVEKRVKRQVRELDQQSPGKRRHIRNFYGELAVALRESNGRRWDLTVRAYDDGVAIRYGFPVQEGWAKLEIANERTGFHFPDDARAFIAPMKGLASDHEVRYQTKDIANIPKEWLAGLPFLVDAKTAGWAAVLDANVNDYPSFYLTRDVSKPGASLAVKLSPHPNEPKVAVRADLPHKSPWRVIMIGEGPGRLIESDLMLNLNDPCAIEDRSWIKTGKTTFPWWNGFYEAEGKVPFKMGLNTETAKYYIDFCAEAGIPYHSLDGLDNIAWYGGTIVPYPGTDITKGIDGLDLQEVLRYAKSKGVKIRLWMHSGAAAKHMEKAFPLYREWGVEGVMVDFFDRDDQEIMAFTRRLVKCAADNHLTITLHNCHEPTGLERTYPNLLTHEGVMNLEYDKWDKIGITPDHEVTIPYTRMLAGPMDFHQGSLRGVPVSQFKPQNAAPLVMGGVCRMLASYVIYQNHLPMAADYPSAYRGNPALPLLVAIPTNWDDTKFVAGTVGESVAIARKSGNDWWLGAMTDSKARDIELPLKFLGDGRYRAEIHLDDPIDSKGWRTRVQDVTSADVLKLPLPPAGGLMIRLAPAEAKPRESR